MLSIATPQNHEEAIIFSGKRFGIDISESNNPIRQFYHLCERFNHNIDGVYSPIEDDVFQRMYLMNPQWFNVKNHWCEKLNCIYNIKNLRLFLKSEGFKTSEFYNKSINELEKILIGTRYDNNYYLGLNPYSNEEFTAIEKENIIEIDPELIITVGSIKNKNILYVTPKELASYFRNVKKFIFLNDNSLFNGKTIS